MLTNIVLPSVRVSSCSVGLKREFRSTSSRNNDDLQSVKTQTAKLHGIKVLRDATMNKGLAFTVKERQQLGIHGLLPPAVLTQENQIERIIQNIRREPSDLAKYIALNRLLDRNEKLFYRVLLRHIDELLPIIYTPTVGLACNKFGSIFPTARGMYISIFDNSVKRIHDILSNWSHPNVKAIVITDGERIQGLGDLGTHGMGIPIGKLALYVALAGLHPHWCLPIMLDVGTDNQELLDQPLYSGLRMNRVRGLEYDEFIDNFMKAVMFKYGQQTLVQFEDFGNHNAFQLLQRYQNKYTTFNDDIQGTAAVALAGLFAANRITNKQLSDHRFLFFGAGEASIGVANLICMALKKEGLSLGDAKKRIWMMDTNGLIVKGRDNLTSQKQEFARDELHVMELEKIVENVKPTALLGAATIQGAFTEKILRMMASYSERPIIFALSNPTSKSECTAEEAYKWTDYRCVFASGSPFDPVSTPDGRTLYPGQGNNAYIFPGVALSTVLFQVRHLRDEHFLNAAETLANMVTDEHIAQGLVFPPIADIRNISAEIAAELSDFYYKNNEAALYPEPEDKLNFVRHHQYTTDYEDYSIDFYDWPMDTEKAPIGHA